MACFFLVEPIKAESSKSVVLLRFRHDRYFIFSFPSRPLLPSRTPETSGASRPVRPDVWRANAATCVWECPGGVGGYTGGIRKRTVECMGVWFVVLALHLGSISIFFDPVFSGVIVFPHLSLRRQAPYTAPGPSPQIGGGKHLQPVPSVPPPRAPAARLVLLQRPLRPGPAAAEPPPSPSLPSGNAMCAAVPSLTCRSPVCSERDALLTRYP